MDDNAENSMPSFSLNCPATATTDPPNASTTKPQASSDGLEIPECCPQRDSYPQRSIRRLTSPIVLAGKRKTHICMECVAEIKNRNTRRRNDWHSALCNGSNVSNMWKHLLIKSVSSRMVALYAMTCVQHYMSNDVKK